VVTRCAGAPGREDAGTDGAHPTVGMPELVFAIGGAIVLIAIFVALAVVIRSNRAPH
jgi:hypothetical protein